MNDTNIELETCPICIVDFVYDKDTYLILTCGHTFHYSCMKEWLKYKNSCPCCRRKAFHAIVVTVPPSADWEIGELMEKLNDREQIRLRSLLVNYNKLSGTTYWLTLNGKIYP